ncbi:MAG: hypothetical protein ABI351_01925, partial [Herbaspirillum sp.]
STLHSPLFGNTNHTIATGVRLAVIISGLATLQLANFMIGQRVIFYACLNPLLLIHIARYVGLHTCTGYRIRIADLSIVSIFVYIGAGTILHVLNPALFGCAQLAIFQRTCFDMVDV